MATAIAVLVCLCLVGGCSRAISGTPTATPSATATSVAGLPATDGPSGLKPGVADAALTVDNTDHGETDKLAVDALSDLDVYWRQEYQQSFGKPFTNLRHLVSYDSNAPGVTVCGTDSGGQVSAFYCPADDSIDWDRGRFLPTLAAGFGTMSVVATLAHAMGHAIEQRAGTVPAGAPAIVAEQQADCFTGAFFRYIADNRTPGQHFELSTGAGLSQVLGALSYVRDAAPGGSLDDNAHGSALDRTAAAETGFTAGTPVACARMDPATVRQRTGQTHFWKTSPYTPVAVTPDSLQAVESSLRGVFRDTAAPVPAITTNLVQCPNRRSTSPAAFCPDTNTVSVNLSQLQQIAAPPQKGASVGYGPFAAYATVASRYALSVENAAGMSVNDLNASLRTGCLVGAWSGLLVDQPLGGRNRISGPRMAPEDVDTVVAELLRGSGLVAANVDGAQAPSGFARLDAFRAGFEQGIPACSTQFG